MIQPLSKLNFLSHKNIFSWSHLKLLIRCSIKYERKLQFQLSKDPYSVIGTETSYLKWLQGLCLCTTNISTEILFSLLIWCFLEAIIFFCLPSLHYVVYLHTCSVSEKYPVLVTGVGLVVLWQRVCAFLYHANIKLSGKKTFLALRQSYEMFDQLCSK